MFERYLATMLQSFLGEYFEEGSFSREKLSVGAWDGSVVLTDLRLKKHALDVLNLPLEIKVGTIGQLKLEIPWSRLGTKPLTVVADRVLLLVVPKVDWTTQEATAQQDAVKRARLSLAEMLDGDLDLGDDTDDESGDKRANRAERLSAVAHTLLQRLLDRFVDSIQVHVTSVHVRYEDFGVNASLPGQPFCVGATLDSLHAMSAEPQAAPPRGGFAASLAAAMGPTQSLAPWVINDYSQLGRDDDFIHDDDEEDGSSSHPISKLLQLNKLSIYWEPLHDTSSGHDTDSEDEEGGAEIAEGRGRGVGVGSQELARVPPEAAITALEELIPRYPHSKPTTKATVLSWSLDEEVAPSGHLTDAAASAIQNFVVAPLDVEVRVTIARGNTATASHHTYENDFDEENEDVRPFIEVDAAVGALDVTWCDAQHVQLLALLVALGSQGQASKYAAYRPRASPLHAPAAAWWRYANRVVTDEVVRAHNCYGWAFLAQRRQKRLEYVSLWKRKRVGRTPKSSSGDEEDEDDDDNDKDDKNDNDDKLSDAGSSRGSDNDERSDGSGSEHSGYGRARGHLRHRKRRDVRQAYVSLNAGEQAQLSALEEELPFDDVIVFRAMGDRQLKAEAREQRHARRVAHAAAAVAPKRRFSDSNRVHNGDPDTVGDQQVGQSQTWLEWLTGGGSEDRDDDDDGIGSEGLDEVDQEGIGNGSESSNDLVGVSSALLRSLTIEDRAALWQAADWDPVAAAAAAERAALVVEAAEEHEAARKLAAQKRKVKLLAAFSLARGSVTVASASTAATAAAAAVTMSGGGLGAAAADIQPLVRISSLLISVLNHIRLSCYIACFSCTSMQHRSRCISSVLSSFVVCTSLSLSLTISLSLPFH